MKPANDFFDLLFSHNEAHRDGRRAVHDQGQLDVVYRFVYAAQHRPIASKTLSNQRDDRPAAFGGGAAVLRDGFNQVAPSVPQLARIDSDYKIRSGERYQERLNMAPRQNAEKLAQQVLR